jgi:hypothetical protein
MDETPAVAKLQKMLTSKKSHLNLSPENQN